MIAIVLVGVAVLVILALTIAYVISLYNGLVRLKHGVSKAWANIDVLLRQRHDELPKLVETCRQHMSYEQKTLERIVKARSEVANAQAQQDITALGRAETELRAGLGHLFALAEQYPQLKASESFVHLHQRISGLEDNIADRRELYNEAVNLNNVRIEQFPDVMIAKLFNFNASALLEFEDEQIADVSITQMFSN